MKIHLLNMEHNRRWMWDERIVALKLQKLHKRIIKVIPNEEYSESSETIRQLCVSHYSLNIFIQMWCFNDTRENVLTYEQCSENTGHHMKRKEEEQKKMCTNFIGSCLHHHSIKFECKEENKTSAFTFTKSPQRHLPHSTALMADLTTDGLWAIKQTIY